MENLCNVDLENLKVCENKESNISWTKQATEII